MKNVSLSVAKLHVNVFFLNVFQDSRWNTKLVTLSDQLVALSDHLVALSDHLVTLSDHLVTLSDT